MNSPVTRLVLCPHSKITMYWYRYTLLTPRNGRSRFRAPVHSPSAVLVCTSRTPSPSSSRAHSPASWLTAARSHPTSASRAYPRHSSVFTSAGAVTASRTTGLRASDPEVRVTVKRSWRLSRPTTPHTGGRSLAQLPWPGRRLPRRRGGSAGSGCGTPFFPRVLVHLIGLHHPVGQPGLVPEGPGRVLQPVPQFQQPRAVPVQLTRQLGGGHPLGDPPEDQHQGAGAAAGAVQERAGEGGEHPVTGLAAVVQDRGAVAAVGAQAVPAATPRAGQAVGVQPGDQGVVAGALVHQVGDREVHGRLRLRGGQRPNSKPAGGDSKVPSTSWA